MKWIDFVKQYRSDHPHLSYKDSMKACKGDWKKHKAKKDYCPKLRKRKKEEEVDVGEHKCKISKKLRDDCKEQCGIQKPRPLTPRKKPKGKRKSTSLSSKHQTGERAKPKAKLKKRKGQDST